MKCPLCNGWEIGDGPWEPWYRCANCDTRPNTALLIAKLKAELDDERDLRYKTQNKTSKRIYELETELERCRKLAHSYIEAYEKLAFADTQEQLTKDR